MAYVVGVSSEFVRSIAYVSQGSLPCCYGHMRHMLHFISSTYDIDKRYIYPNEGLASWNMTQTEMKI